MGRSRVAFLCGVLHCSPGLQFRFHPGSRRAAPNVPVRDVVETARRWKHLAAMTQAEQEHILTSSVIERKRGQIAMFTVLLLVVSAVIVALIVYTMAMEKLREIATLKLIGAPDRTIAGLILRQALAMGLLGFGLGAVLSSLVQDAFPRRVVLQIEDGLALGGVVVLVCVVASGFGVRLALKTDAATALGG